MSLEEEIFQKTKLEEQKLISYGFKKENKQYRYFKNIINDSFRIEITVDENLNLKGKIIEIETNEEYTNFRIKDVSGEFVGAIKKEWLDLLNDIKKNCTVSTHFLSKQSNRIAKLIQEKYKDDPIFKWEKFPGYGVFENKITKKWYAMILNIDHKKIDSKKTGEVEILNIKQNPDKIKELQKQDGFYPAYHMNKTNWITILLNDTIQDQELMDFISESYSYSFNKE